MIFPLILTLAAICQVALVSPVEDSQAIDREAKASYHRFMACAQESLKDLRRLIFLKKNLDFSPIPSSPALNTIFRTNALKPVEMKPIERRVEIKPVGSENLHPFWKRHGYTQQTLSEKAPTALNSVDVNRRAIYINDTKVSWNEARNRCMNNKAQLAIIESAEDEAFMINFMKKHNITRAWIGVHSLFGDNQWTTIKGDRLESLPYVHWGEYQPDNYGGNERCVVLNHRGMNDLACDSKAECYCQWLE